MGAVSEFIRGIQSYEEFAFSSAEVYAKTNAPISSVKKELARLVAEGHIVNIRKGFYIIIPPKYKHFGKLPVELYVDKLFQYLTKHYYIAFYSAAAYHGAAHQQTQRDYIVTVPPDLRNIEKGNIQIRFFNNHNWPPKNIIQKKVRRRVF